MPTRLHAAGAQVAFRFNSFIGLALVERAAGPGGVQLLAVLIGFCVPLYNVAAVWPMARHAQRSMVSELVRNPLIIATVLGLCGGLLGLVIPIWLEPTVSRIGGASLALGLMAAGAGLRLGALHQAKVLAAAVLGIRHLLLPILAALLAWGLDLTPLETTVLMAFSALPTASSSYVLATRMGYDGAFVAGLVTLSTILGVVSIPFALGVLERFGG
jgi:hypothetical protein